MELQDAENHIQASKTSIPEDSLTNAQIQPPKIRPMHTKWRWAWVSVTIILVVAAILAISLIDTPFGLSIGYQILISTIAATLAGLLVVAIAEIITFPKKYD